MAAPLPRLRADLDLMPSPLPEQPGLVIRDPYRYSTVTLVVPPLLARCLGCFDGRQDEGDLRATLVKLAGRVTVGEAAKNLVKALREAGFLDDERFAELRAARLQEIAASPERPAAHVGGAYPAAPGAADGDAARLLRRGAARGRRRARQRRPRGRSRRRTSAPWPAAPPTRGPTARSPSSPPRATRCSSSSGPRTTASPIATG